MNAFKKVNFRKIRDFCGIDVPGNWFKGVERIFKEVILKLTSEITSLWKKKKKKKGKMVWKRPG